MNYAILLLISFTIGYIVQSCIFNLVLLSRSNLRKILIKKLINHDLSWLNYYLLLFILFYLLICTYLGLNTLYLEDVTLNVKLDDVNIAVSGQFLNNIFKNFGSVAAFTAGARLAATFLVKHPMPLGSKIAVGAAAGGGCTISFRLANSTSEYLETVLEAKRAITAEAIQLTVKDVQISNGENTLSITDHQTGPSSDWIRLTQQAFEAKNAPFQLSEFFTEKVTLESKSVVIDAVITENSCSIHEIFSNSETNLNSVAKDQLISSYPIKAPLESGELLQIKPMLVDILTQNLQLNMIILYLICMVLFILTCKFVLSEKSTSSFLRGVLSLPLGYYLHYILSYIIIGWQKSSILWLYFIIFFLLMFNLTSSYSLYACLIILES